jgi:hypothetical protein
MFWASGPASGRGLIFKQLLLKLVLNLAPSLATQLHGHSCVIWTPGDFFSFSRCLTRFQLLKQFSENYHKIAHINLSITMLYVCYLEVCFLTVCYQFFTTDLQVKQLQDRIPIVLVDSFLSGDIFQPGCVYSIMSFSYMSNVWLPQMVLYVVGT